ncbi:glycosyltransferase family 4 protein [Spirulina subsalsa FACHB-351]|uniref:Glycosyltransferase family 4 protein n=1 Tax=Spirulina subsalsa FACHB-351 TaxID=234711 RepID=A0ABT3L614_9CYAN|nr:glycosyltransferase family 4 protein [Spirulina subsalsa]MCW6036948.1 glycosyltransferase family 4 protein [Spirulina subsalsa FACHB-351]
MKTPLKILMMLHMPWNRNLGGSRVQIELADELIKMGHQVEKFAFEDAFPHFKGTAWETITRPAFATKANKFVQNYGHHFDIIDAHQGNLTLPKEKLKFKGLWVSRSVGLHELYYQFERSTVRHFSPSRLKVRLWNQLLRWRNYREVINCRKSFQYCDLINLPNATELDYLQDFAEKTVVFPFGLSQQRREALKAAIQPVSLRLSHPKVAFIGTWGYRKGSHDWGKIIREIRAEIPSVQFVFLGTGLSEEKVLQDLEMSPVSWLNVIPQYDSELLPKLLSDCTVGAFPSYLEGFGFAVLEKLAAGLPTVAYNVAGPKDILASLEKTSLVPVGDWQQFSQKIISIVQGDRGNYQELQEQGLELMEQFAWEKIAQDMLYLYQCRLEAMG